MVLKTDTCSFSGLRIYPGHGQKLIRLDGKPYFFLSSKSKALFDQRRKPQTVAWTTYYRRVMKKDQVKEGQRKRRRAPKAGTNRSVASASLEVIQRKRQEKPEQRQAARDAALREVKERMKRQQDAGKQKKEAQKKAPLMSNKPTKAQAKR